jgi:hypothetical protein
MIRLAGLGAIVLAGGILVTVGAETGRIAADQLAKAARSDSISIPTPGELFAVIEKSGKTNWAGQYRGPIPMTYRNRAQIALNLGGLIADGFIAVEAKDGQQVKNIGSDIIKLAKALGVSEKLLSRGSSINDFAENSEWDTLQEELEATQNEVKSSMQSHADQDLVILVTLGGWIRGTQVLTSAIVQNYDERSAKVLRQPALVHLCSRKSTKSLLNCGMSHWSKMSVTSSAKLKSWFLSRQARHLISKKCASLTKRSGKMMGQIENKEAPK